MQLVAWVVDNLEDVESDMSVFHRVDDIMTLPGSLFFSRAERLGAYTGVVQARTLQERENGNGQTAAPSSSPQAQTANARVDNDVAFALLADWGPERTTEEEG